LTEDEAVALVTAAMKVAGDTKTKDRKLEIRTTYARSDDEPTAGLNKLVESMGEEKGKLFVESLRKIWAEKSPFRTDDRGKKVIANDQANVRRALNKMEVKVYKDEFSYRLLVRRGADPPEYYTDDVRNRLWLELDSRFHFRPSLEFFEIVLKNSAEGNSVHPVREYLESLKWDETPRIDGWLSAYGGAKTNDYVKAVGTIILIAAVKRVMEPGCKFDELLVLESPQGHNKSTMLRTLCPHENWFSDDLPLGVDSKLVIERTAGKWIVEAQELMNMRRTQVEHLKSFLSRQTDGPVRLAYERNSRELQRQFIIIGTTNASTYLKDQTGNRRFWPVRVKLFQVGKIAQDRDQLWAEAFKRYKDGESIRLKTSLWAEAGKLQESRRTIDPWEDKIDALVAGLPSDSDKQRVDPEEVWSSLGISLDRRSTQDGERIAALLERHGFRRMSVRGKDGKVMKGWGRDLVDGIWKPGGWE
jgi:hypothetical protein